jgi:hypothetical protein
MVNKIIGVGTHRLCGPIQTPTHGVAKSFVVFIDDYYRFTIVYFVHQKLKIFVKFQAYKEFVENQINNRIKMFQFDNGGEFTSREFNAFCELHGIV